MIHLTQISKQFGPQIILKKASCQILKGTRSGLVGANGSGKTTIFRLITGRDEPDEGTLILVSHDRYFLRHLVDQVFEINAGEVFVYPGDYDYYLEKTGRSHKAI